MDLRYGGNIHYQSELRLKYSWQSEEELCQTTTGVNILQPLPDVKFSNGNVYDLDIQEVCALDP